MSLPPIEYPVTCPHCGHEQTAEIWTSVNAAMDPKLKRLLLNGSLCTLTCRQCKAETRITHDLVYHDLEHQLLVTLRHPDQEGRFGVSVDDDVELGNFTAPGQAPLKYTYRAVPTLAELIEKIRIVDDGFDDLTMATVKLLLTIQQELDLFEPLFYERLETAEAGERLLVLVARQTDQLVEFHCPVKETVASAESLLENLPNADAIRSERWAYITRLSVLEQLREAGIISE